LSAEAFAPYGEVISVEAATRHFPINQGAAERYHDLARLAPGADGRLIVSIARARPCAPPLTLTMMERHPLGSQAFVPLSGEPWLLIVAAAGPAPTADDLRAFLAAPGQGVNYAAGTWHHPLLALNCDCDFLVLDRSGPGGNCDEVGLEEVVVIESL
jgi:ureidoglycolate lyase